MSRLEPPRVPPDEYDDTYYRTACAGYDEWVASDGAHEAALYQGILRRAGSVKGATVCDIGAGRGELVALAAQHGARWAVGVEYSPSAVTLAAMTVAARDVGRRATVLLADGRRLPLPESSADLVFMIDVVEHLSPSELAATFLEAHRVLRPGGRLIAHTMPTRTIYAFTYRAMRTLARLRGHQWPPDPRNDYEHRMHVNEQTRRKLRRSLRRAGFARAEVSFGEWVHTEFLPSPRAAAAYHWLSRRRLTAPLAIADLWVEATKVC